MKTENLVVNALIAAVYAALTMALAPFSYGPIQVRISECMTLLAFLNPRWVPGLTIGCLLANLLSPFGMLDIIVGTLATFIAVYLMKYAQNMFVASLSPVIVNGLLIGAELAYLGAIPPDMSMAAVMFYIAAGEFISVSVFGILAMKLILRNQYMRKYLLT